MDIEDYVLKYSREDRTKHIDLNTPCEDAYAKRNTRWSKKGDVVTTEKGQKIHATRNLKEYLNLSGQTSRYVHTCHLCNSNTKHGGKCVNPEHLYFGTVTENTYDLTPEGNMSGCRSAVRKAIKNGNHINQQQLTCPHCNKSGKGPVMFRYHFDNCKHK